jgi:hypothetical protein
MRKDIVAAIIAASAATAACGHREGEGGGPTVSRNYQVGAFDQIEIAGSYEVQVRTGANPSVSARGPQHTIEHLVVEVRDGKLTVHPEGHRGLFHFGWGGRNDKVEMTVTVPQLKAATIAGSGDVHVDRVQGDRFDGTIAGSGSLGVDAVDVQALKFSIAGSGDAKAASGKAVSAEYEIAGSGGVEAGGVAAQNLKVSIAGSGDVSANATGAADVSIMGSGNVTVTGGAKCNVSKAGSGKANCS